MMRLFISLIFFAPPVTAQWTLDETIKIAKPEDRKDAEGKPAPQGATVLFDGKSLDAWSKTDGKTAAAWKVADGVMEGAKGNIITKETFAGPFTLHLEFRVPYEPKNAGQGRGNSGVYLQGRYEIQILDSYGLDSGRNDCGAIYDLVKPKVNACKAPTIWQSYDIDFAPPKFEEGKKREPARVTVHHNGILIHDHEKIDSDNTRAGLGGDPASPGPILLQDHGHPVQFRNLWLVKK